MLARAPACSRGAPAQGARRYPGSHGATFEKLSRPSSRRDRLSTTTTSAARSDTPSPSASASAGTEEGGGGGAGGCPVMPFRSSSPSSSTSSTSTSSSPSPPSPSIDLPLPPGKMGLPVLGENWAMLRSPSAFHRERRQRHGDVYKTAILGGPVVVIHDARECRRLLLGEGTDSKTDWPRGTRRLMGEQSILMQSGRRHAGQRRVLGQAFTREAVDGYAPLVEAAAASNLEAWARQGCVRGLAAGKDLAFEVAARALVASAGEGGEDDMSRETMEAFRHDFDRVVEGFLALPYNLGRFSAFGRALRARERVLERIDDLIDKAVKASASPSSSSSSSSSSPSAAAADGNEGSGGGKEKKRKSSQGKNALALMLSAIDPETGEKASRRELRDQILTQLFASHETTGTTIARLLRELDSRPELVRRLREEQDACVAEHGRALSPEAMNTMKLADATVSEALRAWPIVNGVFRAALRDLEVRTAAGGRFLVPEGWRLLLMISSTTRESVPGNREEDFAEFDPERWLSPSTSPAGAAGGGQSFYAPFGAGPHICLGMGLALQEIRAVLALICRDYEWEILDKEEHWDPPMLPEKGLPLLFWRRDEGERGRARARAAAESKGWI